MKQLLILSLILGLFSSCQPVSQSVRTSKDFNFDWKFNLGDSEKAYDIEFEDSLWRSVRLPHDWSVEHSFTQENAGGATAFLPGGIGWYRKSFLMPADAANKITRIEFDGVYTNSEVWINGHYLGKRPFGYAPFAYDLSDYLNYGDKKNVIAVKVDRSAYLDSRWYPGSGIYRNVKLIACSKVNIPQWGVQITTPEVSAEKAKVNIITELSNDFNKDVSVILKTKIYFQNEQVGFEETTLNLLTKSTQTTNQNIELVSPSLWDTENPNLYIATSEVFVDGEKIDELSNTFGIRNFKFDKDLGFFLNGKNMLLKGVCLHHDGGLVGAAVPKGVWERRLKALKEAGCNAIRTAHNPASSEFLDICDEMGFLVQEEAFDEWQNPKDKRNNYNQEAEEDITKGYTHSFEEWAERDIKSMVKRDRNHPSIIMWSIGNEIEWTFPNYGAATGYWGSNKVGDVNYYWDEPPFSVKKIKSNFKNQPKGKYKVAETARKLSKWVKEIDLSRPVTANLVIPSVSNFSGYADALDIVGLSYRQSVYDYCKKNYPDKVFLGTENWTRWHDWKPVVEKDFISGIFLWTGINYMGESRAWPKRGSGSGLLDFAGFKKPSYQMFKALWNEEPQVHITTQLLEKSPYKWHASQKLLVEKEKDWTNHQKWGWQEVNEHWNYSEGDSIAVEVYTNQEKIELFLNDKSIGIQSLADNEDHIIKFMIPYQEGKLTAKAVDGVGENSLQTAKEVQKLMLVADQEKIAANGYDVIHYTLQLTDENSIPVKTQEMEVEFKIDGPAKLLGVDNGSPMNIQDYQSNKIVTSGGKCLLILQSTFEAGKITVKAKTKELSSSELEVLVN
nr:sugar-binding domain-containing protein [uncultured Marinifilum sp.]